MGSIYSRASIVIIAAAGIDPSYGLPGVSVRRQQPQRSAKMGDYTLLEAYPNIKVSLLRSTWRSRAWTYQEGHLGKRRQLFTDQQVSYVCDYGFCVETLCSTINNRDCIDELNMKEMFSCSRAPHGPHYHDRCLAEYTSRNLSYDSDALNACLGVLQSWSANLPNLGDRTPLHLWGLRITETSLDLAWYHLDPGLRRKHFPTWSWADSRGSVSFDRSADDRRVEQFELGYRHTSGKRLSILGSYTTSAATWQSLDDFYRGLSGRSPDVRNAPTLLKIIGICPRLHFYRTDPIDLEDDYPEWCANIATSSERSLKCEVYLDSRLLDVDRLDCIAMLTHVNSMMGTQTSSILLITSTGVSSSFSNQPRIRIHTKE